MKPALVDDSIKRFCYAAAFGVILISFDFYDELGYQFKFNVVFFTLLFYLKGVYFMEFDLQNLIASVGFPITLSMYLLVRIEGKLQTLSDSINELSKNIISMR